MNARKRPMDATTKREIPSETRSNRSARMAPDEAMTRLINRRPPRNRLRADRVTFMDATPDYSILFLAKPSMNGLNRSTGIGKSVVELFSAATTCRVCRYRN